MKNTLIVGMGEIGTALKGIFFEAGYKVLSIDKKSSFSDSMNEEGIGVMHIAFPYSEEFESEVKRYQNEFKPQYTIVHSTVPVGTCSRLGVIHSPVIGIHPYLKESIKTFTKFLGGENASEVADYFRRANIKVYLVDKAETTELMKILCTTKYGVDIEYVKDVKKQCEKYGVPFEAWTLWNHNYNQGYQQLGQEQFTRPILVPIMKRTGGHCVLPNAELIETPFTELIKVLNSKNNK